MGLFESEESPSDASVEIIDIDNDLDIFKNQLRIQDLQNECKSIEQVECKTDHMFSDGVYVRTMFVPAGTFVIGKVHKFKTVNIMTKGTALIYAGPNKPAVKIEAPLTFVSNPMERKMAFFLEDSEWVNVHPTEQTDLEKIESEFIIPDEEYLNILDKRGSLCLG